MYVLCVLDEPVQTRMPHSRGCAHRRGRHARVSASASASVNASSKASTDVSMTNYGGIYECTKSCMRLETGICVYR